MTSHPAAAAAAAAAAAISRALSLGSARRVLVLTGAGLSTAAGIPDYRSPGRPAYTPLRAHEFERSAAVRRTYWARSFVGWPRMASAAPTAGHLALARWAARGAPPLTLITQNVDRLHSAAAAAVAAVASGAPPPLPPPPPPRIELHGPLHDVHCMDCGGWSASRAALQAALAPRNAAWLAHFAPAAAQRPDGDVALPPHAAESFHGPRCASCGSERVTPSVVFFGGNVPPAVREAAARAADAADALLVIGSTVSTYSALSPIAIVNRGETRAYELAGVRVGQLDVEDVLQALDAHLQEPRG